MDRVEPRHEPDLQDLTFRRAPRWAEPPSDRRFALGIAIFLAVALAYPWYSYWVQTHLLARDIEQGVEEFSEAMGHEARQVAAQMDNARRESAQEAKDRRIASVRVTGISDGRPPLAIVELGPSNFYEATETICIQTSRWLRRPVSGSMIRVQNFKARGSTPPIQQLVCP